MRIGTLLNPGTNLVPMAVARLKQLQPRILVTIDLDESQPLIEKLLKGELDIVVGRISGWRDVAELEAESLADERHAVIASTRHPFDRSDLRLEDLAGHGWILPSPGSPLRDRLLSQFMDRDLPAPNNVVESSSLPVITNLLRVTSMVAPLPKEAVQSYCDAGLLTVLIDDLGIDVGAFGLVRRRERPLSPGARAMANALRDVASHLYPQKRGASNVGTAVRFTSRGERPT